MSQFIVFYKGDQYDVNEFLDSHPAGKEIILPFEGKDMTEEFEAVGHSKSAIRLLNKYLIGSVDKPVDKPVVNKSVDKLVKKPEESNNQVVKKLFTAEDQYHIHKLFGTFALLSLAYVLWYYQNIYENDLKLGSNIMY